MGQELRDVKAVLCDALGGVAYEHLGREKLADLLAEALAGKRVLGDDAAFAAGTRNAVEALDTVRIPVWATLWKPAWFQDFEAVREILVDTVGVASRGDLDGSAKLTADVQHRKGVADIR